MKVQFYKHSLNADDKKECMNVLNSYFLTTGEYVSQFEGKLAQYTKNKFAVGLTNATDALFLAMTYYKIGPGDEVIVPALSFIASANVVEMRGAKPVFVDVEEDTGNINADLIESAITKRTKAIVVVHLYGQMCDMKRIKKIAQKYRLKIVEDSAHCIEGERDSIKPGNLGDITCYSFYATKNITSGEGGAITCNDEKIYTWFKKARLHGMSSNAADRYTKGYTHYDMEFLGYKANMTNIQASLLLHQIDRIDDLLIQKEKICQKYNKGFSNNPFISYPQVLPHSRHARHVYTIWVTPKLRDEYLRKIQELGVGVAVNFRVIHLMKYYKDKYGYKKGIYPVAERIGDSTITLPLYPKLKLNEIHYVIKTLNTLIKA